MGNDCAKLAFCSTDYPCTTRNVLCCACNASTLCCCRGLWLENNDQVNLKLQKEQRKAPVANVMVT